MLLRGIQDFPGTVRVNGTLSQDTPVYGAGQGGTEAYLLYNVNVNERMIKAYHNRFADPRICPPDTAKFAHVHHHLVSRFAETGNELNAHIQGQINQSTGAGTSL